MTPTLIGLATLAAGLWLFRKGPMALLCAVLALGIIDGSAGIILTSLGGSSVTPSRLMMGFLILSCALLVKDDAPLFRRAVMDNGWLVLFCLYGFIGAMLLPRIFQAQVDLVPLRPIGLRHLFDVFPLYFSNQNVTTAVYLLGTGMAALCAYVAAWRARDLGPLVSTAVAIAVVHSTLGLLGVALKGTPWDMVVDFFRNGSYAQLDQQTESFIRINGLMPEPSSFAMFGLTWFVLCFELWLRHVRPAATGAAAGLMAVVLVLSTSSTAYVGLGAYAAVLVARAALMPPYLRADKLAAIAGAALALLVIIGLMVILYAPVAEAFQTMFRQMTVEKADSLSGQQRAFWAWQGVEAFKASYGIGVGAGSFRSSSLATAILGSMGVFGVAAFVAHVVRVGWPQRGAAGGEPADIADAMAWAALVCLLPALVMQASPDPGVDFACFSGIALALKARCFVQARAARPAMRGFTGEAAPRSAGWRHVSR